MIKLKICEKKKSKPIFKVSKTFSDSNILPVEQFANEPQTHSHQEIEADIDQLSYQKMFSSNEIDQEFDFFESQPPISQMGVSPGLSITSYDLEQTDRALEIQPYGSVSYNHRDVPQIVLALRRRPALPQLPLIQQQSQESCKTLSNFSSPDISPFQNKKVQIKSQVQIPLFEWEDEEIFSVFDDEINYYGTIPQSKIDFLDHLQQFLLLYKVRAGQFPRQRENLENEIIISIAMNLAKIEKPLFKKYFPSKKVYFDDENDYTRVKKSRRKDKRQLTLVVTPEFQYVREEKS